MFVGLFLVILATWSYVLVPVLIPVSVSALSDLSALDPVGLSVESKRLCSDDFAAQSAVFACVNESSVFFPNTVNKAPGVAHAAVIICRLTEIKRVHCLRAVMEDYWEQKLMPGRPITLCHIYTFTTGSEGLLRPLLRIRSFLYKYAISNWCTQIQHTFIFLLLKV